ncbi:MAG: EamA family transporter [Hyphomicrobiaceae bacterium]
MTIEVFLAVLAAAAMHAGWNAVVKGGGDPFVTVTHVSLFSGGTALLLLPTVSMPKPGVWLWLAASALIHTAYRFMLIGAYRSGDMTQVYPIMRGAAPLLTAIGTALLIGEVISLTGFAAVGFLSLGVFLMSLKGGRLGSFDRTAVGFALLSATCTCAYSLVDGIGARLNGSGPGFALWMFVLNMLTMQAIALAMRGPAVYATLPATWRLSAGGGLMSMLAYFIVIWGMTKAPIALVAALRETSVLFGALLATLILKEPVTGWRVLASLAVVLGVVLLRVA